MQNYWERYDWLTRAYAFKCVGAYESQILVDFTDNPSDAAALSPSLSLSLWICATTGQKTWRSGWWNFMKERRGVSHAAILGHVGKLMWMWRSPHLLRLAHTVSVWERDPPDVSLGISLGRQLEGGADSWHGAAGAGLAVTFWRGFMFRSHVQCFGGLMWYPTESVGGRGSAQRFTVSTTNRIYKHTRRG